VYKHLTTPQFVWKGMKSIMKRT